MGHSIAEIATALGAECAGATDLVVTGAAEPALAGPGDLALAMDPKYAGGIAQGAGLLADVGEVRTLEQAGQLLERHPVGHAHADGRTEQGMDDPTNELVVGEVIGGGCVWFHEEAV